jgi:hypothetical protein
MRRVAKLICLRRMFPLLELPLCERKDSKAEIYDVFLCHNSVDKAAVREIAQKQKRSRRFPG